MDSELNNIRKSSSRRSSSQPQSPHNHDDPNLEHGLINDDDTSTSEQEQEPESLDNKYAPFARHDMYGIMGRGTLPWSQKILFLVSLMILLPLRVVFGTLVVCVYYLICKCCTLFLAPKKESEQEDYGHMGGWRRKVVFWFGRVLSRLLLFVFGFYWIKETIRNPPVNDSESDNEVAFYCMISWLLMLQQVIIHVCEICITLSTVSLGPPVLAI